jgi:PUA-domain protein
MKVQLSKRDLKEILSKFETYNLNISKKDKAEIVDKKIILINDKPFFFLQKSTYIPTLNYIINNNTPIKKITVDKGAIPFVIKGADIMRPGIVDIEQDINQNDYVLIIDQTHKKPLAIGLSLYDSETLKSQTKGKVIKNLHYVGDEIWNYNK